jgi:hypothetical protein
MADETNRQHHTAFSFTKADLMIDHEFEVESQGYRALPHARRLKTATARSWFSCVYQIGL